MVYPIVSLTSPFLLPCYSPLGPRERKEVRQSHYCSLNWVELGGETQINATFPESSKETSTLQQLLCNLKASSATWALWAQEPGAASGLTEPSGSPLPPSSWGSIHTGACPEDALLLLPTCLISDTNVEEGPEGQKDLASPLLQPLR